VCSSDLSFKVNLATSGGMANQILSFLQRGYDIDIMDNYSIMVNNLTLEEVNNAIKKYVDPESVITVIAGSVDEHGKPLSTK